MHETWFDPETASRQDLPGFLQALSLPERSSAAQDGETPLPLLAFASDADGRMRLVLASSILFALFGAETADALSARLTRGPDPGAKRLALLVQTLSLEGAPRLERLRFFLAPGNEILTFLCRRIKAGERTIFLAAALNVRPDLLPHPTLPESVSPFLETGPVDPVPTPAMPPDVPVAAGMEGRTASALQGELRRRWPAARTLRFLWQTDADAVCTSITPSLAEVVGAGTADLVGRNLLELAPQLDPSGRLLARLSGRETWSGLNLDWPLSDAAATIEVTAGAIPAFSADAAFEGFRGFGVIRLDHVKDATPASWSLRPARTEGEANILPFPGGSKMLSRDDQATFKQIGETLRDHLPAAEPAHDDHSSAPPDVGDPVPADAAPAVPVALGAGPPPPGPADAPLGAEPPLALHAEAERTIPSEDAVATGTVEATRDDPASPARPTRDADVSRNGLGVLDKVNVGLLVSRNNVPIFANRHLLDTLGFANEDALHAAGGMTHLFGGFPGNATGSEAVGLRGHDGTIIPANARMQAIEWDGLPATLLTLRSGAMTTGEAAVPAAPPPEAEAVGSADNEVRDLRAILETATDGVAVLDADCTVVSLNRSGEALFGCDRSEVVGRPFLTLFAPHNQSLASDYIEGLKSDATRSLLNDGREFLIKARQGAIPVFMTLGRLEPRGGSLENAGSPDRPRFCALFRDLTPWKKVEQDLDSARREAERASALKSDFLAKVSHEIRTPLNAIIGFAEIIMDERLGAIGNERYKDYLRDIHSSGTHVLSLVNDLLDLSKIEAGKVDLQPVAVDANSIVTDCVSLMQPQASRERVIMRLSLATHLPRIRADERSLRQILLNLLSNAVKFNDPGGQVIVATAMTETGCLAIRIRDTGPGMSDADIEHALQPFHQLSNARPMQGGTGLGLPLAKALVEANQALFTIRSKVKQGTLVEVAFPPAQVLAE